MQYVQSCHPMFFYCLLFSHLKNLLDVVVDLLSGFFTQNVAYFFRHPVGKICFHYAIAFISNFLAAKELVVVNVFSCVT